MPFGAACTAAQAHHLAVLSFAFEEFSRLFGVAFWLVCLFSSFCMSSFIIVSAVVIVLGRPLFIEVLGSLIVPRAVVPVALVPGIEVVSGVAIF